MKNKDYYVDFESGSDAFGLWLTTNYRFGCEFGTCFWMLKIQPDNIEDDEGFTDAELWSKWLELEA